MQKVLQRWYKETQNRFWNQSPTDRDQDEAESSSTVIPYQLWNVSKYGSCVDAAVTGVMPPPLLELQVELLTYIVCCKTFYRRDYLKGIMVFEFSCFYC